MGKAGWKHGTTGYVHKKCRCDVCRAAIADYRRKLKERLKQRPPDQVPHGFTGYNLYGCRCEVCRAARTSYSQETAGRRKQKPRDKIKHGDSGYTNYGCRCEVCRQAKAASTARQKAARAARVDEIPHGTPAGYADWGCRCDACRVANTRVASEGRVGRNAASRETATRHGQQWTGPELEIVARRELTAPQVAAMLGRTVFAVRRQRDLLDAGDPVRVYLAGVPESEGDGG